MPEERLLPILRGRVVRRRGAALAQALLDDPPDDERAGYLQALNVLQARKFPWTSSPRSPTLVWGRDDDERRLVAHFLDVETTPQALYTDHDQIELTSRISQAFGLLRDFDVEAEQAVLSLVGCVVLARDETHGGASVPDLVGAIWLSPESDAAPVELADYLLHETVHQALFAEQIVAGLYSVPLAELAHEEALVTSAIRRVPRSYDLAFDAACVAAQLLMLYAWLGDDAARARLTDGLRETLPELETKDRYLSDRGREVLADIRSVEAAYGHELQADAAR